MSRSWKSHTLLHGLGLQISNEACDASGRSTRRSDWELA